MRSGDRRGPIEAVEVLVVGGGVAGAALAARVAGGGRSVMVVERQPSWRWRACGVFSSPVTMRELRRLGVDEAEIARVARPIRRLLVESPGGTRFALDYGHRADGDPTAIGFDRSALDPLLLAMAEGAGAVVCRGTSFVGLEHVRIGWHVRVRDSEGERTIRARIVVGADGIRSRVADGLGVTRRAFLPRIGLTFHVGDSATVDGGQVGGAGDRGGDVDGRMVVLPGAYCGLAPVPGGRINVGIVLAAPRRRASLATDGAHATTAGIVGAAAPTLAPEPLDAIAGVSPIAHRVACRAGSGWLLVGDAAGFLDPFTGEGLHRALVSARLGAAAVEAALGGRTAAFADYDAAMAHRFRAKDLLSWVVQAFVAQPALFDYAAARLARRRSQRERFGRVMGDLVPASDAFDPRLLIGLLRP